MTAIVGLKFENSIWMGADSAGISGYSISHRADPKIFFNKGMLFGFTTSFRMGQIIRYNFNIPKHLPHLIDLEYLHTDFMHKLLDCFEKNKWEGKDDEGRLLGGEFLIGYKNNLYTIENDFQIAIQLEEYTAIGCGADLCKGSLYTTEGTGMHPKDRIIKALEAADKFNAGVTKPFNVLQL